MKVGVATGKKTEVMALCLLSQETMLGANETLSEKGMPSELYVFMRQVSNLPSIAGVAPAQFTDQQLVESCSSPEAQGEIIVLNSCSKICNMSCLAQLEQMQVLDISGCSSMDGTTLATAIKGLK